MPTLQEQINIAVAGATILHDTEFVGNLTVNKPITIKGSGIIRSPDAQPAIDIPPKTGPVSLLGKSINEPLRITHTGMIYDIVRWGAWQTTDLAEVPQGLTMQYCEVFGQPGQNSQRGIALNGANFLMQNCKVREIHWFRGESQGLCGWNGPGPFKVFDSYIEASTENILFGGADARIPNLIPSDIEIRRCHLFKPMEWRGAWSCKNIFELKNARRVIIDGCRLENCWADAQVGFGVLFTVRGEAGLNPWATVEDVSFTNNELLNVAGGFQMIGKDSPTASEQGARVRIANNLIRLAQGGSLGGNGRLLQLERTKDVTFENNDANPDHTMIVFAGEEPQLGLIYRKNLLTVGEYGVTPASLFPKDALTKYAPGHDFSDNILIAPTDLSRFYPVGNTFVTALPDPVPTGIGVDYEAMKAAQSGTNIPIPSPDPTPVPEPIPTPTEVSVSGRILKKDGTPVKGARVMINPGAKTQMFTKDDGSYSFTRLKPGKYVVIAGASNAWWVYNPGYRALDVSQNVTNADFTAIDSNDPELFK